MASSPSPANDDAQAALQPGSSDVPIALVTGASRGIGYSVGKVLAERGFHVVAVARTVGGLEELDDEIKAAGGSATLVPLDLRDFDAIDNLGLALFQRFGRVDALVGNAASFGTATPLSHLKPTVFSEVFDVNVVANYRLLRSIDPLLRRSEAGRAVFLTSDFAAQNKPFFGQYAASKAALNAAVLTYAAEIANSRIRCNLFDPGPVRTALRGRAFPGEDPGGLKMPSDVASYIVQLCMPETAINGALLTADSELFDKAAP
ncbi:MAG: SDR family NAD(P)-dependent oxidoreductase [Pseudomonadota bacterium]